MSKSPLDRFGELNLFFKNLPKGTYSLLITLSIFITELEVQRDRISEKLIAISADQITNIGEFEELYNQLLTDIHFYIISWDNVYKVMKRISNHLHDPKFDHVLSRRTKWFEQIRKARNRLEHLDGNIVSSGFKSPYDLFRLGGFKNRYAIVLDYKVDLSERSFRRITNLTLDLERWLVKIPVKSEFGSPKYK